MRPGRIIVWSGITVVGMTFLASKVGFVQKFWPIHS